MLEEDINVKEEAIAKRIDEAIKQFKFASNQLEESSNNFKIIHKNLKRTFENLSKAQNNNQGNFLIKGKFLSNNENISFFCSFFF